MRPYTSRRNLVDRGAERWKPLPHTRSRHGGLDLRMRLRGMVDIQFGTVLGDVATFLGTVEGRLLDVGCGDQPFRGLVPPVVKYTGIDKAEYAGDFEYRNEETIYYEGDRWPLEDGGFDAILCTEVLEHVVDPAAFLAEASRCLAPGGTILLTVPFAARWHYIPHDYWRYTPSSLNRLLTSSGFDGIAVYSRGDEVTVACYKVMALILPLLFPQNSTWAGALARRAAGVLLLPLFAALVIVANVSLRRAREADDCLGFTAIARKRREVREASPHYPAS
jgi:SAM-dependent methyltransferase